MSSKDVAIEIQGLSKCYHIYDRPQDRLKQSVVPRLRQLLGRPTLSYFREFWALRDVSFQVFRGETVGIVGRNGSGKSTLLQIICGTLAPTGGTVEIAGRVAALLELGAGFNPEFTGRENVYLNASVLGLKRAEIDDRFDNIGAFADIGQFIEQPVKTYSSGMVVRLAFAVAINVDPEILVVDEALAVGDELFQRKCYSRIEAIRGQGATILFVSHSGSTITDLCDRAVLIDAGETLAFGPPKQIVGRYQRLLYAPEHRRDLIREEIRTLTAVDIAGESDTEGRASQRSNAHGPQEPALDVEGYDPALKPESTISYEARGAVIESPGIFTLGGEQVNILVRGRTYRYVYDVGFARDAARVRFGMLIKTLSGVELGGAVSGGGVHDAGKSFRAPAKVRVEFRFNCIVNPGVYFLNAGVSGEADGTEVFLHRLLDASIFRVVAVEAGGTTGTVDFGCVSDVIRLDGASGGATGGLV